MKFIFELPALDIYQHPVTADWFVKFHNWVSIAVGQDKPEIVPGDRIRITLEKVTNAQA